ncbi:hypothetical protein [Methylobacter sp. YRD-M1]|uniref:hypothetical protein n=1 Tax=Methylobacter sp. YRD-M1 TaxID=2911520 RepID=UPI00227B4AD5|nr:hypothetical protein [Methylobacter sp. YRD-M1]WAK02344.1 hypothetical protein LZ558_00755 [Methylobacter sp. YRD-M1]
MKETSLLSAMLGVLAITSTSAMATGFVTLPSTGFTVSGGTSAYTLCNTTGDFGSQESTPPTFSPNGGANNTCAVFSNNPPLTGYSKVAEATRNLYTSGIKVGTLTDQVWRDSAGTSCVYAAKIRMDNVDSDPNTAGTQYFEVNDVVRAGFRDRGPVSIAYNFVTRGSTQSDEVLFRAGLTKTSVVHEPGDDDQPLTSVAPIDTNWVDFTTDVNYLDPDGSSMRDSSWFYVKSGCTSATPTALSNALIVREMGQEGQAVREIKVSGYAPAGADTF